MSRRNINWFGIFRKTSVAGDNPAKGAVACHVDGIVKSAQMVIRSIACESKAPSHREYIHERNDPRRSF